MKRKLAAFLALCLLAVSLPMQSFADGAQMTVAEREQAISDFVKSMPWAFCPQGADEAAQLDSLKRLVALDLWNHTLNHDDPGNESHHSVYVANNAGSPQIFDGPVAIADKLSVVKTSEKVYYGSDEYEMAVYKATLDFSEIPDLVFTVCGLQDKQDVVVDVVDENGVVVLDTDGPTALVIRLDKAFDQTYSIGVPFAVEDGRELRVYGNGIVLNGLSVPEGTTRVRAYHVAAEHMGSNDEDQDPNHWWRDLYNTNISQRLFIYDASLQGIQVEKVEGTTAAAWGFAACNVWETNGTDEENPMTANVYYGNTTIRMSVPKVATGSVAVKKIKGIAPLMRDYVTLTEDEDTNQRMEEEIIDDALSITLSDDGTNATVRFKNDFYNEIPLAITYEDRNGDEVQGNILLKREGLNLAYYVKNGDGDPMVIYHGTDSMTLYPGTEDAFISASFYYADSTHTSPYEGKRVEVVAELIWLDADGNRTDSRYVTVSPLDPWKKADNWNSTTHTYDTQEEHTGVNSLATQGDACLDDFILWEGSAADAPDEVRAFAVIPSSDPDTYGGTRLGSESGVSFATGAR